MKRIHLLMLALLSAALFSISWPARGFPAFLFAAFIPLFIIEDYFTRPPRRRSTFQVFLYSYLAFVIWNLLTTWWVSNSTLFGGVFAIVCNSLFMSITFITYHWSRKKIFGPGRGHVILAFFWITFEFLHQDWDLTWSWLNLGSGFDSKPQWVQWYEYTGIFGGAVWVILANVFIYNLILNLKVKRQRAAWITYSAILIMLPLCLSLVRFYTYKESGKAIEAVAVQPNIDPYKEQYNLEPSEIMARIFTLAEKQITPNTALLVCPESAIQEDIWENNLENCPSFRELQDFLMKHPQLKIIIGASTFYKFKPGDSLPSSARFAKSLNFWYDAYNTALFTDTSRNYFTYHKSKLVVGVEKMPFPKYLKWLDKYALDMGGTIGTLGISPDRLAFPILKDSAKVGTSICYESVYGEFVSGFVRNGAQLLCIITNDGWWKDTPGHRQHLKFAALRAIETRRSIVRSANTGISCFVNPKGEILQATKYWEAAVIKGNVSLNTEMTFYVKYGDYIARFAMYASAMLFLLSIGLSIKNRNKEELT